MASLRAAAAARRLLMSSAASTSSRFLSFSSSTTSPRFLGTSSRLLGYFHHPGRTRDLAGNLYPTRSEPGVRFEPHADSSPRLSLDFLPSGYAVGFNLVDSHLGLLLLFKDTMVGFPTFLVCDPVSLSHTVLSKMPNGASEDGGVLVGAALLSRADNNGFEFDAVFVTVHRHRLRSWVASFRAGECNWRKPPFSEEVVIDFSLTLLEQRCVHAAGNIYFHICGCDLALALDSSNLQFSFLQAPKLIWDDLEPPKYRIGETPAGDLCVASIQNERLMFLVQEMNSHDGWVLQREICLRDVLDAVPGLPTCRWPAWLSDIDAGRTGRVFIRTTGCGRFSYCMGTGKLEHLKTSDGMEYGDPIFAFYH
ncbi:unnamed protein product [Urochloa decumbens]|uniref:DUF1618 domain-containing protein n=1 Tax=Urochloa decumbens TaxID=240449 RepID=A0ABC9FE73_9POAL